MITTMIVGNANGRTGLGKTPSAPSVANVSGEIASFKAFAVEAKSPLLDLRAAAFGADSSTTNGLEGSLVEGVVELSGGVGAAGLSLAGESGWMLVLVLVLVLVLEGPGEVAGSLAVAGALVEGVVVDCGVVVESGQELCPRHRRRCRNSCARIHWSPQRGSLEQLPRHH